MKYLLLIVPLVLAGCTTKEITPELCSGVLRPIPMEGVLEGTPSERAVVLHNCRYLRVCEPEVYSLVCF